MNQANLRGTSLAAVALFLLLVLSCREGSPGDSPIPTATGLATESKVIVLQNQGCGMEGHTPRGFAGMGTGLFAGENLNPRFPEDDVVQLFLTFDLSALPSGTMISALLSSERALVSGTPMKDLGPLRAEEVRYSKFSLALWNLKSIVGDDDCEFAASPEGPFRCDLANAVRNSLNGSYPLVQFRLLMELARDNDGTQDLVSFFIVDSNTNQPGIFKLAVTVEQGS